MENYQGLTPETAQAYKQLFNNKLKAHLESLQLVDDDHLEKVTPQIGLGGAAVEGWQHYVMEARHLHDFPEL
jgi:hypothetical protein